MNSSNNDIELIQKYLANKLSQEEKKSFENRLQNDLSLKKSFEEFQLIQNIVLTKKLSDISTSLERIHQEKSTQSRGKWYGVIGGSLLLVVALVSVFLYSAEPDRREEYQESVKLLDQDTTVVLEKKKLRDQKSDTSLEKTDKYVQANKTKNLVIPKNETVLVSLDTVRREKVVSFENSVDTAIQIKKTLSQTNISKNEQVTQIINPCDTTSLSVNYVIDPSQNGIPNGVVNLFDPKGGTGPYEIFFRGEKIVLPTTLKELKAGNYSLLLSDRNNCSNVINIEIENENNFATDYILNMNSGSEVKFEFVNGYQKGVLRIFSLNGVEVVKKEVSMGDSQLIVDMNAISSKETIYQYMFKPLESSEQVISGTITVVR